MPIERGNYRLESGIIFNRFSSEVNDTTVSADLRYGLIQNLELGLEIPYLFREERSNNENQIGDTLLRAKVRFLKGREANPLSVAGEMLLKLPTAGRDQFFGTTGKPDIGFIAVASKEFTPVTAHINFGYIFIGNPPFKDLADQLLYALGLELKTEEEPLSLIAELSGNSETGRTASRETLTIQGGAAYRVAGSFSFDASMGFGVTKDSPDYLINAGFTYLFP